MSSSDTGFLAQLLERFAGELTEAEWLGHEARVTVKLSALTELLRYAKEEPSLDFAYPAMLTAYDTGEGLVLVYRLVSLSNRCSLVIRCRLPLAEPSVPTCTHLWPGMNWHEREVYDMFGIRFEGHPNLKRILLPDDWPGFPFRKNYVSIPSGDPLQGPQPVDPVGGPR